MSKFSVDRETKVISAILFIVALSLAGARYLDRQSFVDWSDVEKMVEYDREATIGDTIEIRYYLVNDRSYAIKVKSELGFYSSIYYSSDSDRRTMPSFVEGIDDPYITIPANSKERLHSLHHVGERAGRLIIEFYGFPDIQIDVLEPVLSETRFKVSIGLNKYVFDSQDTARLIIRNRDSHEITFGSPYFIEKLVGEEWVKPSQFPLISGWDLLLHKLPVGKTTTQDIKIDTLESGHYRVIKTINHERIQEELAFTLEFDIHDEG